MTDLFIAITLLSRARNSGFVAHVRFLVLQGSCCSCCCCSMCWSSAGEDQITFNLLYFTSYRSTKIDFYVRQCPFTPFVKHQNITDKDYLPSMFPNVKCLSAQSKSIKKVKCKPLPVLSHAHGFPNASLWQKTTFITSAKSMWSLLHECLNYNANQLLLLHGVICLPIRCGICQTKHSSCFTFTC